MRALLLFALCLLCVPAFGQVTVYEYQPVPIYTYVAPPVYYVAPPVYYQALPVYVAPPVYYVAPLVYVAPVRIPRVWVHPKVYVEGQPIRNFLQAITP
jgi:hypothetical protein